MNAPGHKMILASAGSGKTYALTQRFVELLAGGAAPERIVALTFTRKAAGEFFDQILARLARAAVDGGEARKLASAIGHPHLGPADFLRHLRTMIEAMPRLTLGTLDGFFARIVRNFPLELGLDGPFQIMEEAPARWERRRVLRQMFAAAGRPDAAQREFIEAFKRATFGLEEKQLARVLDGFLTEHAETFLEAPNPGQWGEPGRIWPEGCAWLAAAGRREAAAAGLRVALAGEPLNEKQRTRIDDFFLGLAAWQPGAPLPKPVEYLVKNAFDAWPGLQEITLERRKFVPAPATQAALRELLEGLAGSELIRRLEMTRGLYAVLRGYERNYHDTVRRAGRLTFADVLRLLVPAAGAPRLSGGAGGVADEGARLAIDWRLDAQFDHWLLDEFQDTSFAQWSVLRNLIDEAVQDPEMRRSFFYVGDVKQSIFSWRGGDPRLFREIFRHYNDAAPGTIAEGRLDASWRSGPAVIAMVNRVFGASTVLAQLAPPAAAARWSEEWRTHETARPGLEGWAELRQAPDEAGRFAETLRLLQEIDPIGRGLEAAVLVRTNATAAALAEYLRREGGLAAVAESDRPVATDNPLTVALLALLRAAAHPGDTLARELVTMTPLGALLAAAGLTTADAQTKEVLAEIHERGFAGVLESWLRRLEPALVGNAFALERGRMLVTAAAEFDRGGSREIAAFLDFAGGYLLREVETAGAIRVLTIHKSKGLGFDVVILPDLEGQGIAKRRDGLAIRKEDDRAIAWVLQLPSRLFAEHDPVLAGQILADETDAAYENLCLLYVAMTRAKRAMYLITEPGPAKSTSANFPRLLQATLGASWSAGRADWFGAITAAPVPLPAPEIPRLESVSSFRAPRRTALTPSGAEAGSVAGALLFNLERGAAADFGQDVHRLFAEIEWSGPAASLGFGVAGSPSPAAMAEVLACLSAPVLAGLWAAPTGAELWRERSFEVVLDGAWVTGIFDRVVVERDAGGRARRARVIDFKTDRVPSAAELTEAVARHAPQINLYRRVVAILAGLPLTAVECELVFTRLRRSAIVPWL